MGPFRGPAFGQDLSGAVMVCPTTWRGGLWVPQPEVSKRKFWPNDSALIAGLGSGYNAV
jgi:hypothetical protein